MAVAIARGHGNGHDAECRKVVWQLRDGHRSAAGIGLDLAEEECGCGKARAQDVPTPQPAATTWLVLAFD